MVNDLERGDSLPTARLATGGQAAKAEGHRTAWFGDLDGEPRRFFETRFNRADLPHSRVISPLKGSAFRKLEPL